jgi:hypothetical protein
MNSLNPLLIPLRVFESCLSHVTASIDHPNSILDMGNMLRNLDLAQKFLFVYNLLAKEPSNARQAPRISCRVEFRTSRVVVESVLVN